MNWYLILLVISLLVLVGCAPMAEQNKSTLVSQKGTKTAIFAGGCFWCLEGPFEAEPGVIEVVAGYTGGNLENPTYQEVSSGKTGHREAIKVIYDPKQVAYEKLVEKFFWQIDPTDPDGQFADRGFHYTTAVYYFDEEQKKVAEERIKIIDESGTFEQPVVTEVLPAKEFYLAEDYHQDYYKKQSAAYQTYSTLSGRKGFIKRVWGQK